MTVAGWFTSHGLPWDERNEESLKVIGVICVEHLKLLERLEWDRLFSGDSLIYQRMASKAYNDLKAQSFDSKKAVDKIPLNQAKIAAASDDMWNFDHDPTWYETIGNYSWGPKDSG